MISDIEFLIIVIKIYLHISETIGVMLAGHIRETD